MGEGNLRIEDEEEIISAITHALCSILDKELRKTSLARLLCSSYSAVEKIVCFLPLAAFLGWLSGIYIFNYILSHCVHLWAHNLITTYKILCFLSLVQPFLECCLKSYIFSYIFFIWRIIIL